MNDVVQIDRIDILKQSKICFGPMSKNFVDCIIDYSNSTDTNIVLIPSRRQIEYNGGYVNNWTTKEFAQYIYSRSTKIAIQRDHGGPLQGSTDDDGYKSLYNDCLYFDSIHIDPWKKYQDLDEGTNHTIELIKFCHTINNNIYFEIGTEEAIRKFTTHELNEFIFSIKNGLDEKIYNKILFCVIQSGTALENGENIGVYEVDKLIEMIEIIKKYNLLSKEHNGDFMVEAIRIDRYKHGLNSINIAPEIGSFETSILIENINPKYFAEIYDLCFDSGKWKKWINFNPYHNKKRVIEICCHYIFSNEQFIKIKNTIPEIDNIIHINFTSFISSIFSSFTHFYIEDLQSKLLPSGTEILKGGTY